MKLILGLFIAMFLVIGTVSGATETEIDECMNITTGGVYDLNQSLNLISYQCLSINSDDVFIDCKGNTINSSFSTENKLISIDLYEGWNMISIPLEQNNWSVPVVLSSIDGQYSEVRAHDAQTDTYLLYLPGLDPIFSTLTELDKEHGYYVNMTENATLTINGTMNSSSITLYSDWNLISFQGLKNESISEALSSISGKYNEVQLYDAVTGDTFVYLPNNQTFSTFTILEPLKGYWIKMQEAATLNYFSSTYGFKINYGSNITIDNCTIQDLSYGVHTNGNTTIKNTNINNGRYGVFSLDGDNINISYSTITNSSTYSAYIFGSTEKISNTTIEHNTFQTNGISSLGLIRLDGNTDYFPDSFNIKYNNFTIDSTYSSYYALTLVSSDINSNVTENRMTSGYATMYMNDGNATIWNNFFNGSVIGYGNSDWNITKQAGTPIYGIGSEIGGNFYTNSGSTGHSDTCLNDNSDGFCSQYEISSGNIDFLPLTLKQDSLTTLYLNGSLSEIGAFINNTINITVCSNITGMNKTIYWNGTLENYSTDSNCLYYMKDTTGKSEGTYNITVYSLDDTYHYASEDTLDLQLYESETPIYSDIKPSSSVFKPSESYILNCTWGWDLTELDTVILNFNGTNYTITDNATVTAKSLQFYSDDIKAINAGTYSLYWWANNTGGAGTQTPSQSFTITKITPSVSLDATLWSVAVGQTTNITGTETNDGDDDVVYYLNLSGATVTNPYSYTPTAVGNYLAIYYTSGGTNYTSTSISAYISVGSGGGGGSPTEPTISGNWSFYPSTKDTGQFIVSSGSAFVFEIPIRNNMEEKMQIIVVDCIPSSKGTNICPYITYPNELYRVGGKITIDIEDINIGKTGSTFVVINLTKEHLDTNSLIELDKGSYEFSLLYDYKGKINTFLAFVTVGGIKEFQDLLSWLSMTTDLGGGLTLTNSNIAIIGLALMIVVITLISSLARRKKRRFIKLR